MPLDPAASWAADIAAAIKAVKPQDNAPVSDSQLEAIWTAVKTEDTSQLGQAAVAPGSFSNGAGSVSGVGGPVT